LTHLGTLLAKGWLSTEKITAGRPGKRGTAGLVWLAFLMAIVPAKIREISKKTPEGK